MNEAPDREAALAALERTLGHRFRNRALLRRALRHASFAHERRQQAAASRAPVGSGPTARPVEEAPEDLENNERLEFLGDAVLGLVVAEALYRGHPDWREGHLTRAFHALVEGRSLARRARTLGVGGALALGRTEQASGGAEKASILENTLEAIVGAVYLDAGLAGAVSVVERLFGDDLSEDAGPAARDPKTALQETLMAEVGEFPTYRLVRDSEIEGDDERFEAEVCSLGRVLGRGRGRTKRAAERRAAAAALARAEAASPERA